MSQKTYTTPEARDLITGRMHRLFRNYRIRALLCAGRPNWDLREHSLPLS